MACSRISQTLGYSHKMRVFEIDFCLNLFISRVQPVPGEKKEIRGAQEAGCVKTGKKGKTIFKLIESHQPTCRSSMKGLPGPPGPKGQEGVPGPKVTPCNPVVVSDFHCSCL